MKSKKSNSSLPGSAKSKGVTRAVLFALLAVVLSLPAQFFQGLSPAENRSVQDASKFSAAQGGSTEHATDSTLYPTLENAPAALNTIEGLSYALNAPERGVLQQRYSIPFLDALEHPVSAQELDAYQMVRKAKALGIDAHTLDNPLAVQEDILSEVTSFMSALPTQTLDAHFTGDGADEFQAFLDSHAGMTVVLDKDISLDGGISLKSNTTLDGRGHALMCSFEGSVFTAQEAEGITVKDVRLEGGADYGFTIVDSDGIVLQDCSVKGMRSKAAVFSGACRNICIEHYVFENNERGGVYFAGNCSTGLISDSTFSHNGGCSNHMAGIVLTQIELSDPFDVWADFLFDPPFWNRRIPLEDCMRTPHDLVFLNNTIEGNQSSGIYCDGSYRCFFEGNTVTGNDKEGMCLDYGSIACYVHRNSFEDNGWRGRQDDTSLELDGMLGYGRAEDGAAIAKLPAVSLDNALYNVLEHNNVAYNWGGGIKAVRTALRNTIVANSVVECNRGENSTFKFIGIEIGNALVDEPDPYMDFKFDLENIVAFNYVAGAHYTGILVSDGAAGNYVHNNIVTGASLGSCVCMSSRPNSVEQDTRSATVSAYRNVRKWL